MIDKQEFQRSSVKSSESPAGDAGCPAGAEEPWPKLGEGTSVADAWFLDHRDEPLGEFVLGAVRFSIGEASAARECDSRGWKSRLFYFAWLMRGREEFAGVLDDAMSATDVAEESLRRIYPNADDVWARITDGEMDEVEARDEFAAVWRQCRHLPGIGPLEQAVESASRSYMAIHLPTALARLRMVRDKRRTPRDYGGFLAVAQSLQTIIGDKPIALPLEKLGELLRLGKSTISRYRQSAVEDGYLVQVEAHRHVPGGKGKATAFRFIPDPPRQRLNESRETPQVAATRRSTPRAAMAPERQPRHDLPIGAEDDGLPY